MKNALVSLIFSLSTTSVYASTIHAVCTNKSNSGFIEEKIIKLALTPSEMTVTSKNDNFKGTFDKVVSNGSRMYDSSDLTDLCDQCDIGKIFISPALAKGIKGNLDFSVRQIGDSEGFAWLKESFSCTVTK